jgi:hypothetical protein
VTPPVRPVEARDWHSVTAIFNHFVNIGVKRGRPFDMVWMQKEFSEG